MFVLFAEESDEEDLPRKPRASKGKVEIKPNKKQTMLIDAQKALVVKMSQIVKDEWNVMPKKGFPDKKYFGFNETKVTCYDEVEAMNILIPPEINFKAGKDLQNVAEGQLFDFKVRANKRLTSIYAV